jgi:hypothetical protein
MSPFKDIDGTYSVRKFGGYTALVLLAYLIISFSASNGFKIKIPTEYLVSLDAIITFYFIKNTLYNLRVNSKVDDATKVTTQTANPEGTVITEDESTNK